MTYELYCYDLAVALVCAAQCKRQGHNLQAKKIVIVYACHCGVS